MQKNNFVANRQGGFSLIELMTVVAIIAILASVAVPAYVQYVKQGKVTRATSSLSDMRIQFEQYFQDNRTYVGITCPVPSDSGQSFNYACGTPAAATYTLTATGVADMANFTYTIDQDNAKTSKYDGAAFQNCWTIKKGQAC